MKSKNKVNLSLTLGLCALISGCTPKTPDNYSAAALNTQPAYSKPIFDVIEGPRINSEADYSHLVKDGRFLKGKLSGSKDKKPNQQAKSSKPQYKQEGYASWYDSWFHGRKTSSGVEYDEDEYSAAHRTLPIPSVVKVINLENKKTVTVVVNDRGPVKGGKKRIIDLSRRAAEDIDIINKGIAKVKVEFLPEETKELLTHLKPAEQKKAQVALSNVIY